MGFGGDATGPITWSQGYISNIKLGLMGGKELVFGGEEK